MKKRHLLLLFLMLILSINFVFSHEGEEDEFMLDHSELYPVTQLQAVGYGSLIFSTLIVLILLFHKKMNDMAKKIMYSIVLIVVALVTIYLVLTTLHLNVISITKGPVHWHADFEVVVCDKELKLPEPKGLSNKQGVDLMHAHNDNRVHVEGVILDKKQASLGAFFYAVGGSLTSDGMKVSTNDGLVSVHDGNFCNEKPAKLYVFVNGNLIENPSAYVIAPYEKVPPGDRIKFVFTEKPIEEVNPNIGGIPLGSESEKFFDEVLGRLQKMPQGEPMTGSPQPLCDLDGDFDCDNDDLSMLEAYMGKCLRECHDIEDCKDVPTIQDLDADGCVTSTDREIFFQLQEQYNKK